MCIRDSFVTCQHPRMHASPEAPRSGRQPRRRRAHGSPGGEGERKGRSDHVDTYDRDGNGIDDQVDFEQAMGTLKGWERDRRIAQLAAVHGALEVGEDRTRGIGR